MYIIQSTTFKTKHFHQLIAIFLNCDITRKPFSKKAQVLLVILMTKVAAPVFYFFHTKTRKVTNITQNHTIKYLNMKHKLLFM